MTEKTRLGILFGGRSCEHEVSVTSARSMLAAVNKDKYDVTMIGIDKQGQWLLAEDARPVLEAGVVQSDALSPVLLDYPGSRQLVSQHSDSTQEIAQGLDVVFPLLHGPYGEDGTMQGLLELAGVAYVGSGVVGSAVGMDKEMMKRAFRAEGLQQTEHITVRRQHWQSDSRTILKEITGKLAFPLFVKPANMGSSVGVSKAHDESELIVGINTAAEYDYKVIVEAGLENCHEVECAVLGNEHPKASVVGEILPGNEFYDYQTKYIDDKSDLIIPAKISEQTTEAVREMSLHAFQAVEAAGLARVDFFVRRDTEQVYVNEINTMPGFTPISMYPKLWEASGISYTELIDRLIELALERQKDRQNTRTAL